jgi:hypothetical protein
MRTSPDPFIERIDRKFDAREKKLDHQFRWVIGLEITKGIVGVDQYSLGAVSASLLTSQQTPLLV